MTGEFGIAVHALVYLNHAGGTLSSENIAKNVCTNPARIRKIMSKLKKAHLVDTREGVDGGYMIARESKDISLRMVCDAVEAVLVSANWRSGDLDKPCMICSGMADIMDELYGHLNQTCKDELSHISIEEIQQRIFCKQEKENKQ